MSEQAAGIQPMADPYQRPAPSCAICHLGPHRYGTTDPEHRYDAMGCVNMLLPQVAALTAAGQALYDALDGLTDSGYAVTHHDAMRALAAWGALTA